MAANPLDMPILISQLPNVQLLMGPQHAPHEAQQALFSQLVAENQKKAEQTVQVTEKGEGAEAMGRDSGGNKNASQNSSRQGQRPPPQQSDPAQGAPASNASPWAGNIINVKI